MTGLLVPSYLKASGNLGLDAFDGTKVELRPDWTEDDLQAVFKAAYRQVLGNDYIMKSERLTSAESLLRQGNISVRDFVRAIAKSDLYKEKFFYPNNNQRFVELNFKHLLGRPPYDEDEWAQHTRRVEEEGYDAEIDSYFESREYESKFGDNIVPYYTGFSVTPGVRTVGFSRMFQLYRGYANNDRGQVGNKKARLTRELANNQASSIKTPKGSSFRSKTDTPQTTFGGVATEPARMYRVEATGLIGRTIRNSNVRRSNQAYLVPYEQLSDRIQQILRSGGKILNIRPA
ncbi:phycobilisome rod-core linker polypeptide [Oscillatoria salina]|uniref:phycobilisome rod-core linker polypeptide n=1 Tax=Oscillatoria salina TaxID=331517 RepID=UPI0013B65801|nr:phycobilisome rod-core linker polypeptide [Oscillatoria salina]MBZ8181037.1 photosystem I reaction center subunit XII [Oscillatoria salina IIICB1]NET90804.1 photosystem I reaction center subunit XII [Kamptonema sp. SIO1D9]